MERRCVYPGGELAAEGVLILLPLGSHPGWIGVECDAALDGEGPFGRVGARAHVDG